MWPTPTPIPPPVATPVLELPPGTDIQIAEWAVQTYQMLNQYGILDMIWLVVLVILITGGVVLIINQVREL